MEGQQSGLFMISNVYPSGPTELEDNEKMRFMVNIQRLKHHHISGLKLLIFNYFDSTIKNNDKLMSCNDYN